MIPYPLEETLGDRLRQPPCPREEREGDLSLGPHRARGCSATESQRAPEPQPKPRFTRSPGGRGPRRARCGARGHLHVRLRRRPPRGPPRPAPARGVPVSGAQALGRGRQGADAGQAGDGPCLASPGALASERGGPSSARTPGRRRDVRSAGPGRQGRLASSPGAPYFVPSTGGRPRPSAREPVKEPQLLLNT